MTRERADDAVRRLARVDDEQVARLAGAEGREALLEGIVHMPAPVPTPAARPRRRRRVSVVGGGIALTLAASGTIGWAVASGNARDTTALQCQIDGNPSIIDAVSGDPVADCAAEWERQNGRPAPVLAAYDNGHGGVLVQPATDPAPSGAKPLPPGQGQGQNVALIELDESLADYIAGLSSRCFSEPEAVAYAERELDRLRLTEWVVKTRRDSDAACYDGAAIDAPSRTVLLIGVSWPQPTDTAHMILARRLREVAKRCLPLAEAKAAVEAETRELGLSDDPAYPQYKLTAVPTDTTCTSFRERVGGSIFITLRGPAS